MNLYFRSFSVLRNYWKQLLTATTSAAMHALFSGLLIWMFGPLLMTLFQPGVDQQETDIAAQVPTAESPIEPGVGQRSPELQGFMGEVRTTMKNWVHQIVEADTQRGMLINFCLLILIGVMAKNFFLYLQGYNMAFVQQSVMKDFRDRLFIKYQKLSLSYYHANQTGKIMSRVSNDVVVLNEAIDIGFNRLVTDSLLAGLLFSFLIILSWKLTIVIMIIMPVVFGFIWFIGRKLRKYSTRSQERMADVNSVLEESINNVRIVKAFSMESFEIGRFMHATGEYFKALLRMTRIRHLASPINDTLATIAGTVILFYAGSRIMAGTGEFDVGDFMTYLLAMFALIKPGKSLSQIHIRVQEGMAAATRVFEVLDTVEDITDPSSPLTIKRFEHSLQYEHISFSYRSDEPVLRDISFEVKPGEVVAIVGPSGAGKSTLLDLLPRFYDPKQGSIRIDGHDVREYSLASLRSLMGIVTQETFLFNDTIRSNIAYGLNGIGDDAIVQVARMANADKFIREFTDGYNTVVGNRGVKLSGGQRQRLAIARALLKNPQILIFDEATSSLDTESEMLVQEAIDRLMEGRTALVIAHRLSTIKNADRILVLDNGRIVECGPHDELNRKGGLYHRLYNMQFRGMKA